MVFYMKPQSVREMKEDMMKSLQYRNEDDRAYGLAGMLYSLGTLDGLDSVAEVYLDSDGPMVTFSHSYYFSGSPSISPKATWENLVRNFHLTAVMAVSNVMSRSLVRDQEEPSQDLLDELFDAICAEGKDECSLDDDEIRNFYDRVHNYGLRLFGNPRVHPALRDLTSILARYRRLSGREVREQLEYLQLI